MLKARFLLPFLVLGSFILAQEQESYERPVIDASDQPALEAAKDTEATVRGKIAKAEWSRSGKVCNITFENAPNFVAVVFEANKAAFDAGFCGDFAATMTGATVKLTGKIAPYGGHDTAMKGSMQMILGMADDVTVVTPANEAPATHAPTAPPNG